MSKISTFYDNLNALLTAKFGATHKKLDNPYIIEDNSDLILKRGYGFNISGGSDPKLVMDCYLSARKEVTITLTVVNRGTERDITIRENAEKLILEDHRLLQNSVILDPNLNELLAKIEYQTDNGIEFIFTDKENYLMIRSVYLIEYLEDLTP